MKEQNLSYYINKEKSLDSEKTKDNCLKIALLSNFTINGLKEVIRVKCNEISIASEIYESGYNQISQEIIDNNSGLHRFKPNITFLIINSKYISCESYIYVIQDKNKRIEFIEKKIDEFIQLINLFIKNISGILVVSNLKGPSYSPLGINEEKTEMSVKDIVNYFNQKLKETFLKNNRVFIYDFNSFFTRFGEYNVINEKLNYFGDIFISPEYMPYLAEDLMSYIKPYCSKIRKCIVLDLDNTLWGGIIGEDGFNNIKLDNKPPGNAFFDFQNHILGLYKRGIILAINSKNNPEDALEVIRKHPYMVLREENFASIKINWNDKVTNMKEIAKEINIGTDSLVFVDDDHMNRALVKEAMPEVLVVDLPKDPSLYVRTLKEINDFNTLQLTDEDFKRGEMYYNERKRNELKTQFTDMESFLKNLNIEVKINAANEFTIPRISQLSKKTNQFNLTTRRYTEEDIRKFVENTNYMVYSVNVKDKFGDYGLTGVFIIKKEFNSFIIDTFLLSCRVIGRNIEKLMIYFIAQLAQKNNISELVGEYIPTQKNKICENMYEENGFDKIDEKTFKLTDFKKIKPVDYIKLLE